MRSRAVPKTHQDLRTDGGKLLLLVSTRFFICLEQILVFSSMPEQPPSPTCARTPQSCQTSFSYTHSAFKELWKSVTAQHKCSLSEMQSWKCIGKSGTKLYCQCTPCHGEVQDILDSTSPGGHQYFYSSFDNFGMEMKDSAWMTGVWKLNWCICYRNWSLKTSSEKQPVALLHKLFSSRIQQGILINITHVPEVLRIPQVRHVLLLFLLYMIKYCGMRIEHLCGKVFLWLCL